MMFDSQVPHSFSAYQSAAGVGVSTYVQGLPVDLIVTALDQTMQNEDLERISVLVESSPAGMGLKFGLLDSKLFVAASGGTEEDLAQITEECGLRCPVDSDGAFLWQDLVGESEQIEFLFRKDLHGEPVGLKGIRDIASGSPPQLLDTLRSWAQRLQIDITGCEVSISSGLHSSGSLSAVCDAFGSEHVWKMGIGSAKLSAEAQQLLEGSANSTLIDLMPLFSCEIVPNKPYSGVVATLKPSDGQWQVLVASYILEAGKLEHWLNGLDAKLFSF